MATTSKHMFMTLCTVDDDGAEIEHEVEVNYIYYPRRPTIRYADGSGEPGSLEEVSVQKIIKENKDATELFDDQLEDVEDEILKKIQP